MSLNLKWVGPEDYDRVAETRLHCYGSAASELPNFKQDLLNDGRAIAGDYLLADENRSAVATASSLSMFMWIRGTRVPCQGVAYVGTIRTARRGGVAAQLMAATIAKAREREQVVSALMPFRASFYERFGYGIVERRTDWTVPLPVMPTLVTPGLRYATNADRPAIAALRQRFVEQGQCDIETTAAGWLLRDRIERDGFQVVDDDGNQLHAWAMAVGDNVVQGRSTTLRVTHAAWDSPAALLRLLSFLGGQRDQFNAAILTLPSDLPLNRMLRESQMPHRPVPHQFAEGRPYTRMQIRVLDHRRLLESLHMPDGCSGSFTVGVQECEGQLSRMKIDLADGRLTVQPFAGDCDVLCTDRNWASIVCGDVPVRIALATGLIQCDAPRVIGLLDSFAAGPPPFCNEYF